MQKTIIWKNKVVLLLVFLFVVRNEIFRVVRSADNFNAIDTNSLMQVLITVILFSFLLFQYNLKILYQNKIFKTLFFLFLFSIISGLWSPFKLYTVYIAFECSVYIVAIYCIFFYSKISIKQHVFFTLNMLSILLLIMLIGHIKIFDFKFNIWHTNTYTVIAGMLLILSLGLVLLKSKVIKTRKLYKYIIFSFTALALGTSSGSNVATIVGLFLLFFFYPKKSIRNIAIILFFCFVSLYFLVDLETFLFRFIFPDKQIDNVLEMTGRVKLWDIYINKFYEKPFFGWGFGIISRISDIYNTNTHNSFISFLTGLGIVGCLFLLSFLFQLLKSFKINAQKYKESIIFISAIIMGLINSNSNAFIGEKNNPVFIGFLFVLFSYIKYISLSKQNAIHVQNNIVSKL